MIKPIWFLVITYSLSSTACLKSRRSPSDGLDPSDGSAGQAEYLSYKTERDAHSLRVLGLASPAVDHLKSSMCAGGSCQEELHFEEDVFLVTPRQGSYTMSLAACTRSTCVPSHQWTEDVADDLSGTQAKLADYRQNLQKGLASDSGQVRQLLQQGLSRVEDPAAKRQIQALISLEGPRLGLVLGDASYYQQLLVKLALEENPATSGAKLALGPSPSPPSVSIIGDVTAKQSSRGLEAVDHELRELSSKLLKVDQEILDLREAMLKIAKDVSEGRRLAGGGTAEDIAKAVDKYTGEIEAAKQVVIDLKTRGKNLENVRADLQARSNYLQTAAQNLDEMEKLLTTDSRTRRRLQIWGVVDSSNRISRQQYKSALGAATSQEALVTIEARRQELAIKSKNAEIALKGTVDALGEVALKLDAANVDVGKAEGKLKSVRLLETRDDLLGVFKRLEASTDELEALRKNLEFDKQLFEQTRTQIERSVSPQLSPDSAGAKVVPLLDPDVSVSKHVDIAFKGRLLLATSGKSLATLIEGLNEKLWQLRLVEAKMLSPKEN